jgi:hypothetical protein
MIQVSDVAHGLLDFKSTFDVKKSTFKLSRGMGYVKV